MHAAALDPEAMLHGVAIAIVRGTYLRLFFLRSVRVMRDCGDGKGWD